MIPVTICDRHFSENFNTTSIFIEIQAWQFSTDFQKIDLGKNANSKGLFLNFSNNNKSYFDDDVLNQKHLKFDWTQNNMARNGEHRPYMHSCLSENFQTLYTSVLPVSYDG